MSASACARTWAALTDARSTFERSCARSWPWRTKSPRSTWIDSTTPITALPISVTWSGSITQRSAGGAAAALKDTAKADMKKRVRGFIMAVSFQRSCKGQFVGGAHVLAQQRAALHASPALLELLRRTRNQAHEPLRALESAFGGPAQPLR